MKKNKSVSKAAVSVASSLRQLPQGMPHDKDLLLEVFKIQNPSRNRACNDFAMKVITQLAPKGCTVVRSGGNLLIRKGPASGVHPHYLAHMDQVHDYVPFMKLHITGNVLHAVDGNNVQTGVGGDDKCGIYLALMMLHKLDHCTAVFVRDEEVGCLGSGIVPLEWFEHASFVIQADRNNRTMDIIRDTNGMCCASDDFMARILDLPVSNEAGHSENTGSITDVGELATRGLDVSMVNISSGYHNPHSKTETVKLDELGVALRLAYEAAVAMGDTRWSNTPQSKWFGSSSSYGEYGGYGVQSGYGHKYVSNQAWGMEDDDEWVTGLRGNTGAVGERSIKYREDLIYDLVTCYGYDREFDCLDNWTDRELEDTLYDLDNGVDSVPREEADDDGSWSEFSERDEIIDRLIIIHGYDAQGPRLDRMPIEELRDLLTACDAAMLKDDGPRK